MSSAVAIAAVTAALKDLLNNGLLDHDLSGPVGSFSVTSLPPDRIATGETEPNQLNLFLYQLTPNLGWRNTDLPSRDSNGARRTNAPLAVDLHYVLTAYGSQDLNAEILLGYAMQLLHETPVLTRAQLRTVLDPSPVNGAIVPSRFGTLAARDLADQIELIKISPIFLSTEELSKMWTAMQARYRPTMAYMVSVVLIQATSPVRSALPVLTRGQEDTGPVALAAPFPNLSGARPAVSDVLPAMRLGDDLILTGTNLDAQGLMTAIFEDAKAGVVREIPPVPASVPGALKVHVPGIADDANVANKWTVGLYSVSLRVSRPNLPNWTTNTVPIALAPSITVDPLTSNPGDIDLTVSCVPRVLREQEAQTVLIFDSQSFPEAKISSDPIDLTKPTRITFKVPAVKAGNHVVRLRVQGIDSLPVRIDNSSGKLEFDPQQKVIVA